MQSGMLHYGGSEGVWWVKSTHGASQHSLPGRLNSPVGSWPCKDMAFQDPWLQTSGLRSLRNSPLNVSRRNRRTLAEHASCSDQG